VAEETTPIVELGRWFQTPPGRYVLAWERAQFDERVADMFGFQAWQVGLAEFDLLRANRMPFKAVLGSEIISSDVKKAGWTNGVAAQPESLPFDSQTVDLLVLPHAFECTDAPHQVLREVERVLVPEGHVVISGFNPWSLWGARNAIPRVQKWLPRPPAAQVSPLRMKDWLKLMSFDVDATAFGCYAPPCRTEQWLRRWHFVEPYGRRWWPPGGAVYVMSATKRVAGIRLIGPAWKKKRQPASTASVAVQRNTSKV
jgi:SAM-dependent methyltransferase